MAKRVGFTLAEVLLTLGIIGIIASMTIPNLIQKQQEMATASALKKAYSTLSNAFTLAVQENGTLDYWGATADNGAGSKTVLDKMIPYLNVTKNCGTSAGCFPSVLYKTLDGGYDDYKSLNPYGGGSNIQLSDGSLVMLDIMGSGFAGNITDSTLFASIVVDINGFKGPNQFGRDTFVFGMFRSKIIPAGAKMNPTFTFPSYCGRTGASQSNGRGCAAWVIYNENMDYLHCDDLLWDGKHTCS